MGSRERLWLATGGSKRGQRVREGVIGVPKARYLHRYDILAPSAMLVVTLCYSPLSTLVGLTMRIVTPT
jgi:hypothetical protein